MTHETERIKELHAPQSVQKFLQWTKLLLFLYESLPSVPQTHLMMLVQQP